MLVNYEQYQAFIFDMDGTLLDTMPAHLDAWKITAHKFGFPYSREWINSMGGMPSAKIIDQINKKFDVRVNSQYASRFKMETFKQLSSEVRPIEVTNRVLDEFAGVKRIAIGTGSQRESAERLIAASGLTDKIAVLVTANDVENHKPHPDTFLLAAKQLRTEPEKCLVFEDTKIGKQAAHAAGMDCLLVEGSELVFYPCEVNSAK